MTSLVGRACLVTAVAFALTSCSSASRTAGAVGLRPEKDRRAAPDFALKDSTGKTIRLSEFKGKVVLLNFWATWCSPCRIEIPWFMEFEQKHKDQGFAVVGVAMDDDGWDVVKPYLERHRVNYRVVMGTPEMADLYGGVESLPTTFLIDREGRIAMTHIGLVGKRDYQDDIDQLLGAQASDSAKPDRAGVGSN